MEYFFSSNKKLILYLLFIYKIIISNADKGICEFGHLMVIQKKNYLAKKLEIIHFNQWLFYRNYNLNII